MVAQTIAILIFVGMFLLIILDKFERHYVTLASGALMLLLVFGLCMRSAGMIVDTLNFQSIISPDFWVSESESTASGINWPTIAFIAGMMIMVEGMGQAGFFRWICLSLAKLVHYRVVPLLLCFMFISAFLSMFIGSITVVLFLATVTIELARLLKFNPVPMIIAEIFCSNLGGAATMSGDPPNIIIGTSLGFGFVDFIANSGLIVLLCFIAAMVFFWLCFRKELKASEAARPADVVCPEPASAITNKAAFASATLVFVLTVVLLITHAQTHLTVACIGVISAALTIVLMAAIYGGSMVSRIFKGVDYKTLLFFIGLFVSVAGLEQTGVLTVIANFIRRISGGDAHVIVAIILILSAVASGLIDNIPFAATMIPVIQSLAASTGVDLSVMAWSLSLGTDMGGNATPIGASANVVGTSISAKNGHPIGWGYFCKYCIPGTAMVIIVSLICLFVRYF
ncbi:MAG: SLC13 family permease [Eubacteriales bacterium]|nr:SLC13 family permease [Eubacteriales bacterium]